jgi:uncharacterized SAM-binding protein YcdF (DUF218 family)
VVPSVLKDLLVPGSAAFFILSLIPGTLLLYRRKDGGRAGKIWVSALVLFYWMASTPVTAVALVGALTPDYPHVRTRADAHGATAVVVLGAGMETHRSRGEVYDAANREHALRMLEAARVYRVLDRPWVIVTGGRGSERRTDAYQMFQALSALGVPEDRILQEDKATNTRDHALLVPPMLAQRGVKRFVLVTSRQHMTRSLRAFRAIGLDPIPSSPEFYVGRGGRLDPFLPSEAALDASTALMYDQLALVYYWMRGWL